MFPRDLSEILNKPYSRVKITFVSFLHKELDDEEAVIMKADNVIAAKKLENLAEPFGKIKGRL